MKIRFERIKVKYTFNIIRDQLLEYFIFDLGKYFRYIQIDYHDKKIMKKKYSIYSF